MAKKKFNSNENSIMGQLLKDKELGVKKLRRGQIVEGTVLAVENNQLTLDVGSKSEAIISGREFDVVRDNPDLYQPGNKILVFVVIPEGEYGHSVVSLKKALPELSWRNLEIKMKNEEEIEGKIVEQNRGGVLVDIGDIKGFIPSSLLDTSIASTNQIGRKVKAKIVELNRAINRVILSEKTSALEKNKDSLDELLKEIEVGSVVKGTVTSILPFGVFVLVKGFEGLIPISELATTRVENPEDIVKSGQELDVKVVSIDQDSGKITFSLKRLQENPWETAHERYYPGKKVTGRVTKVTTKGAFVELEPGLTGILPKDGAKDVEEDQEIKATIASIEPDVQLITLKAG